jgi:hypothetical protein
MTENQPSIFIVNGINDYEGNTSLGAYSTLEAAKTAVETYIEKAAISNKNGDFKREFDNYSIIKFIVDAEAEELS